MAEPEAEPGQWLSHAEAAVATARNADCAHPPAQICKGSRRGEVAFPPRDLGASGGSFDLRHYDHASLLGRIAEVLVNAAAGILPRVQRLALAEAELTGSATKDFPPRPPALCGAA